MHEKNSAKKYPMFNEASNYIFKASSLLRKRMTEAEIFLWERVRKKQLNGYKFRRQHPLGRYVLDFYCNKKKLVIELDGKYHEKDEQRIYDEERTKYLELLGLKVIRFKNEQVLHDIEGVLQEIKKNLI